jgi:cyclophilin family peptidyl-prolyl cis-trans isomerase
MMKKSLACLIVSLSIMLIVPSFRAAAQESETGRLILIETSLGDMHVKLYDETPAHRDNMIKLIEEGFFNGQLFHRVVKDFMIQGGDPHSVGAPKGQRLGSGGPGYTIPAEFNVNLIHKKGALAAARKGDQINPEQASNGSQFYLVQGRVLNMEELNVLAQRGMASFTAKTAEIYTSLGGTPHLDGAYTVFGEVVRGLEVLDLIVDQQCDSYNRPVEDVIFSVSIIR